MLSFASFLKEEKMMAAGFEPATYGLEGRCSIQLSYATILKNYFEFFFPYKNKIKKPNTPDNKEARKIEAFE